MDSFLWPTVVKELFDLKRHSSLWLQWCVGTSSLKTRHLVFKYLFFLHVTTSWHRRHFGRPLCMWDTQFGPTLLRLCYIWNYISFLRCAIFSPTIGLNSRRFLMCTVVLPLAKPAQSALWPQCWRWFGICCCCCHCCCRSPAQHHSCYQLCSSLLSQRCSS